MQATTVPARTSLTGSTLLMACACGAASNTAKLVALAGLGVGAAIIHPAIIALGAALIILGLWRQSRPWAGVAAGAFVTMAAAAVLLPQHEMASGDMGKTMVPWNSTQLTGAALFIVAITGLAYAFWRAYPSPRPAASGSAIGGMALATGCTCCMVTGATAGMLMTLGATAPLQREPILFWLAMAVVAGGVYRLGGLRAASWVPVGALLIRTGLDWINQFLGEPKIAGINPYFVPKYALMLGGYAVLMYAFSLAYKIAEDCSRSVPALEIGAVFEGAD